MSSVVIAMLTYTKEKMVNMLGLVLKLASVDILTFPSSSPELQRNLL